MSREYQYYWFNITSDMKFDKNNASIQTVTESELKRAIGLFLFNLEQRNELDSIPRLLKNIKRYTISESGRNVPDDEIWLEGQMNSTSEPKGLVPKLVDALDSIEESQLDDAVKIYIGDNFELGEGQWEDKTFISNLYLDIDPKEQSWKVKDIIDESQHAKFRQDPFQYSDSDLSTKQQRIINEDSEAPINLPSEDLKKAYDKDSVKIIKKEIKPNSGEIVFSFEINLMDTEFNKKELRKIFPQQKIIFTKDTQTFNSQKQSVSQVDELDDALQAHSKRMGEFKLEPAKKKDRTLADSPSLKHNAEINESWLFNALDDDAKEGLKEWAQSEIIPIPNYVMHGRSDDPIWLPKGSASALKRKVKIPEKKGFRWELNLDNKETAFKSFWDLVERAAEEPELKIKREKFAEWKAQHLENLNERERAAKDRLRFESRLSAPNRKAVTALMQKGTTENEIQNFIEDLWKNDVLYNQFLLSGMPLSLNSLGDYTITITLNKTVGEDPTAEMIWRYDRQQTLNTGFLTAIGGSTGLSRPQFNFGKKTQHARKLYGPDQETDPELKDRRKQASLGYNKVRDFLAKHVTSRHKKIKQIIEQLKEED